ncbi:MAG: SDR family NAD(P)-dependent oxidoreductase, partial [Dysgonamonadaceae bacterium]|nr:SDR family NAD(P)-dependent oxidoreductase [Dysgonamonadaceae bacterium]
MTEYIIKVLPKHGKFPHLPGKGVFLFDLLLALIAFVLTTFIHAALSPISINWPVFSIQAAICVAVTGLFYYIFKTNSGLLRYFTFKDTFRIWFALLCANVVLTIIHLAVYQRPFFTLAIFFVNFLLTFIFVFFFRISVRLIFDYVTKFHENKSKRLPVLVYGVEPSNISLAEMIDIDETSSYQIAGFISPSSNISNQKIISKPVYFRDTFYSNIRKFHDVEAILIQPEEITRTEKQLLAEICYQNKIELLSVPSIQKWDDKKTHEIKNFNIEDLLGRTQIEIDTETIKKNLKTKKVLITGAAGSIGSEIVRQLCLLDVDLLILCDNAETPLHQLCLNLKNSFPHVKFVSIIADVRNRNKMEHIFSTYKPHCVYHAAAYKHVPMMEDHPCEAVLTNVLGSKNVADMAVAYGAENYVMISTDKAVNPSSVMGATKRIAEIYIQSMSRVSSTRFITTRFGNVLGSSGSVIPLFEKQIEKGGPVTLTDPQITRYFMTIPEACSLVLEA